MESKKNGKNLPKGTDKSYFNGNLLRELREFNKFTREDINKKIPAISPSTLYKIEYNKYDPRFSHAVPLANLFKKSLDFFAGREYIGYLSDFEKKFILQLRKKANMLYLEKMNEIYSNLNKEENRIKQLLLRYIVDSNEKTVISLYHLLQGKA